MTEDPAKTLAGPGRGRPARSWLGARPGPSHVDISVITDDRRLLLPRPCIQCTRFAAEAGKQQLDLACELEQPGRVSIFALDPSYEALRANGPDLAVSATIFRATLQEGHTITLPRPAVAHVLGDFRAAGPVWVVGMTDRLELWSESHRLQRLPQDRRAIEDWRSTEMP